MRPALDLAEVRFGHLVAVRRVGTDSCGNATWRCICDCGAVHVVSTGRLRSGDTRSCGCSRRDMVGYSAAHKRVRRAHGGAVGYVCECGSPAQEWAYSNADPDEQTEKVTIKGSTSILAYSLDLQHYAAMCVPCHKRLDAAHRQEVMA